MNTYSKIAEGLAAWLTYEHRCGRANLFSEASLTHPLGDLLQYHFAGRVRAEVEHPFLAARHTGVGKKPRVDFVVEGSDGIYDLAVEAKWASRSPTLLPDILADIIRLDLLRGTYAREVLLVFAGEKRAIERLIAAPRFRPCPSRTDRNEMYIYGANKHLLPIGERTKSSLRFAPVPPFRRSLYVRTLRPFRGIALHKLVQGQRTGPYPRNANARNYEIYVWRLFKYSPEPTFLPEEESAELAV